jgi:hypothetical protein
MMRIMQRIVRIASVASHGRHAREDWAAMSPNGRVALLERMRTSGLAGSDRGLRSIVRVRRLDRRVCRLP